VSTVDPQDLTVSGAFGLSAPEVGFSGQPDPQDLAFLNGFRDVVSNATYQGVFEFDNPEAPSSLGFPEIYPNYNLHSPAGASMPGAPALPVVFRQVSHVSDV
jgi:hypothetical protein